ncbi:MAG: diacylglycerol/polyprenol kinase family protein [Elusimicrobiota bacterium]
MTKRAPSALFFGFILSVLSAPSGAQSFRAGEIVHAAAGESYRPGISAAPSLSLSPTASLSAPSALVAAPAPLSAPAAAPVPLAAAPLQAAGAAPAVTPAAPGPAAAASAPAPARALTAALAAASLPLRPDAPPTAAKAAQDRLYEGAAVPDDAGYQVQVSQPGKFGRILRHFWPAHTLFRVTKANVGIAAYLPATLTAFPQANPSLLTRIKKGFLFSPPVVRAIRSQLAHSYREFEARTAAEILALIQPSSEPGSKYNIVIDGSGFNVMGLDHGAKVPDWILSKHVLMSGYSKDVRFAGEIWRDADGRILVSDNSGTYRPSAAQLDQAVAYLKAVFPGVEFVAAPVSQETPAAPAPKAPSLLDRVKNLYTGGSDLFKKEVRRKTIHQKNWGYLIAFLMMGYPTTAYAFAGFTGLVGAIGLLRMHWAPAREFFQRHFGSVLRAKEATRMTGFFYGALGMTVAVALYGWSKPIVAAAVLAYVVGDAVSPLVGMRFDWMPYTIAGTRRALSGTLAAFAVVLGMILALGFPPLVALGAALVFSAVDTYPVKPDDNFWIPVAVSTALFLFGRT